MTAALSPSAVGVVFLLLGAVVLASAVLVVTTRQLVHAALWAVVTLGALAGCYLLLSAELVAWVQVLIYVGAVIVLVLFGLMLTTREAVPMTVGASFFFASGSGGVKWGVAAAVIVVAALPPVALGLLAYRQIGRAMVAGAVKG